MKCLLRPGEREQIVAKVEVGVNEKLRNQNSEERQSRSFVFDEDDQADEGEAPAAVRVLAGRGGLCGAEEG